MRLQKLAFRLGDTENTSSLGKVGLASRLLEKEKEGQQKTQD